MRSNPFIGDLIGLAGKCALGLVLGFALLLEIVRVCVRGQAISSQFAGTGPSPRTIDEDS